MKVVTISLAWARETAESWLPARKGGAGSAYRHGYNPGSVRLGGQRHPVSVPRVRDSAGEEASSRWAAPGKRLSALPAARETPAAVGSF